VKVQPINLAPRPKALARPQDLVAGSTPREWFKVSNADGASGDKARIDIYDAIDSWGGAPGESLWGVSAEGFIGALRAITAPRIALHVNSPGGDVWDGIAILNALLQHPAAVTAYVDGYAASIASVIVMGADEVELGLGAQMMIHDASTVAWGNTAEVRAAADLLDKVSDNIAGVYAVRTGVSAEHWRGLMQAETWFNADEAVAAGLATRMVAPEPAEGEQATDKQERTHWARDTWRVSDRDHAPAPKPPHADPADTAETPAAPPDPVYDGPRLVRALREAVKA
jgi:ATP-dependent protease ClpP protease subunit